MNPTSPAQPCRPSAVPSAEAPSSVFKKFVPWDPVAHLSGNLPHWRQDGTTYFVTFRTADSLPQEKLETWMRERMDWMAANPEPCTPAQQDEYHRLFSNRIHHWLDQGYGACPLAKPEVKELMEQTLSFFTGERYLLDETAVMPNHVHTLVTPLGDWQLSQIVRSWKSYSARMINRLLGTTGPLWQRESFDHIVRDAAALDKFRRYIRDNPKHPSQH